MKKTVYIDGMHCAHCTGTVKKALEKLAGVSAEMSLEDKTALVSMTSEHSDDELRDAVCGAGFKVVSISQQD